MANVGLTFVILLQCILLNNINCDGDFIENSDEFYKPQIQSVINHLNQDLSGIYKYNYVTLINAQNKDDDSVDLTIDIELECLKPEACTNDKVKCHGTVQHNAETATYDTLPGVTCHPKIKIDLSKDETVSSDTQSGKESENDETKQQKGLELIHEVGSATDVSGEQFIAFRSDPANCVGCAVNLNTDVEGLDVLTDTVLQHAESESDYKYVLKKVLSVQRQVVKGVKYILVLKITETTCSKNVPLSKLKSCIPENDCGSEICEVTFLQQPWISKSKHIIANNCTRSQEFSASETRKSNKLNDMDNEIDVNYGYKTPRENRGLGGIMSPARMTELETQIMFRTPNEEEPTSTTESGLSESQKSALEDFLDMMGDEPRQKRAIKNNNNNNNNDDSSSSSSSDEENHEKTIVKTEAPKHDDNNNNNNDDSSSSSDSSSDEENNNNDKHKHSKKNKRNIADKNKSSDESSEEQTSTVAGPKLNVDTQKIKKDSSEENSSEEQAPKKVKRSVGKSVLDATPVTEDVKEEKQDETPNVNHHIVSEKKESSESVEDSSEEQKGTVRRRRSINSQLIKISPDEKIFVHNLANIAVNELDDIDADNHKRLVLQVLGAKKMITDGILYHMTLRVGVSHCPEERSTVTDLMKPYPKDDCRNKLFENLTKICKVQVHVTEEKMNPKIIKSHCQDIKKDVSDSNRTFRAKRAGVPGGINPVALDDPKLLEYAKEVLKQVDAHNGNPNKQELVQIIEATKQVVAGILYKMKLEIKIGKESMICNYEVWDRPWVSNGKQVTIQCEGEKIQHKYRFKRSVPLLGKDDHDIHIALFKTFTQKFSKKYDTKSEFKKRFHVFRENMKLIKRLNDNEQGTAKYGPTMFADMTYEEFQQHLGLKPELRNPNNIPYPKAIIPNIDIPVEFDWRKKGVISEVKNQGSCGSCWAFSVTGNIEGLNAIKTGNLIELSEQELVDCDTMDNGCSGGLPDNAYRAIEKLGGLETESDYPYEAENEKCHFNQSLSRVQITGAVNISSDEKDMAKWLVQNGPISIGINANAMQFYMGGVSHPWQILCDPKNLDHGVLIVGYGVHKYPLFNKIMPYWIIKNSWGELWGEQGYYRVYRGDGTCGVNQMAESATLD